MDKTFIYMLFFTGVILIYIHHRVQPPPPEYRYLPNTLDMESEFDNASIFKPMFNEKGLWIKHYKNEKLGSKPNMIIKT